MLENRDQPRTRQDILESESKMEKELKKVETLVLLKELAKALLKLVREVAFSLLTTGGVTT